MGCLDVLIKFLIFIILLFIVMAIFAAILPIPVVVIN